jgi:hypothetical protein
VQVRSLQAGDRAEWAEGWQAWLPSTTLTSVVLDPATLPDASWALYPGAANEFRARVVDQDGLTGPWSAVAVANIVMDDVNAHNDRRSAGWYGDLSWGPSWHTSSGPAYYFGTQHVATASRAFVGGGDLRDNDHQRPCLELGARERRYLGAAGDRHRRLRRRALTP